MSNTHAISLKRSTALLTALSLLAMLFVVNFSAFFGTASAADLTNRSLTLSSTLLGTETDGAAGSATNGSLATHTFAFTAVNTATEFTVEYCTNAIGTCTPATVDLTGASAATGDGTFADTSANEGTWTVGVVVGANSFALENVVNPTVVGTFFVRISTDGGDDGTVASAITEGIEITARVAETLGFSTTGQFGGLFTPAPGTSCAPLTGSGAITLGDPTEGTLDITQAYDNYSAFRLYTNASGGVLVQYRGATLTRTAGGDIDPIGTSQESASGTEQFGLAIDPSVGGNNAVPIESSASTLDMTNVTASGDFANNGALTFASGYGAGNGTLGSGALFSFVPNTATTIASTAGPNGYTECKTAAVRYVANVSPTTTSGTYTTTIVYSAVPQY